MKVKNFVHLSVLAIVLSVVAAVPARAQFTPRSPEDLATGEQFHVEGGFGFWMPNTDMSISSEALGIQGSDIDFKKDLGLEDHTFHEFHLVLRPARKHKFRFQYIPMRFEQESILQRDVIFQGIRYRLGVPVNSQLEWKAYRFGYEYDFIARNRGFAGFILDAKYTNVTAALQSPVDRESLHARAPIPTIGGIGRYYVASNISITGELTFADVPESISKKYQAHYVDLDIYGTLNFTNNFGVNGGYRTFNVGYNIMDDNQSSTTDSGSFVLRGLYFGAVARF